MGAVAAELGAVVVSQGRRGGAPADERGCGGAGRRFGIGSGRDGTEAGFGLFGAE